MSTETIIKKKGPPISIIHKETIGGEDYIGGEDFIARDIKGL